MADDAPRDSRTPSSAHIARCIASICGRKHVVLSPANPPADGPPSDVVVQPSDAREVAAVLQYAAASQVPIFPVATDAVAPVRGGVLLDLRRMNRVIGIDEPNGLCTVQPAVRASALQKALAGEGLVLPLDPTGTDDRSIGALVARGEDGPCALRYGGVRQHVVALEVVLPTGELIRTGGGAARDLTQLFIGTLGTLGVVTRITLRALPQPERRATVLTGFGSAEDASLAAAAVVARHIPVAGLMFFDLAGFADTDLPGVFTRSDATRAVLLAEVEGVPEAVDRAAVALRGTADAHGATGWQRADSRAESSRLWEARRMAAPALASLAAHVRTLRVALLPGRVPDLVRHIDRLRERTVVALFGSIGTGRLTFCLPHHDDALSTRAAADAAADIAQAVVSLGGATDAPAVLPPVERKLLRQLKAAFDPAGILSPGVLLQG